MERKSKIIWIELFINYRVLTIIMTEYRIHCVTQDSNCVITHVGIEGTVYTVSQVIRWINEGTHSFHTLVNGYKAAVYVRVSSSGNWFLTTTPDGIGANNLDNLPSC